MSDSDSLMKALTSSGVDEKKARMIVKELIDKTNVQLKTHLTEGETLTFSKSAFYSKNYREKGFDSVSKMIDLFTNELMTNRVSYDRNSRKEFIEALKPELVHDAEEKRGENTQRMIR